MAWIIIIALAGAALARPAAELLGKASGWVMSLVPLVLFVLILRHAGDVADGGAVIATMSWVPSLGVDLTLRLDGFSMLFGLLITGIGTLVTIYAGAYFAEKPVADMGRFLALILLFMTAMLGTVLLMFIMGYGISLDVEDLTYAVLDHDQTTTSQAYALNIAGSRYFIEKAPLASPGELDRRLRSGDISLAIEIPPDFGRDLKRGAIPQVAFWIDGAMPMRADTIKGYVQGLHTSYLQDLARSAGVSSAALADIAIRYRYNPDVQSLPAMVPAMIPILLMMIPAMLTALGVVREKELGSITNFYAAPVRRIEFLIGKQLPYIGVAMLSVACLLALMLGLFGVPFAGGPVALLAGALLYTTAATAFGLVVSTFVRSQIAAIFATAIIVMIPAVNFSGMMYPAAALEGAARVIGHGFPSLYFQNLAPGVFNKGLDLARLYPNHLLLAGFVAAYWVAASVLLRKQED